ncbi:hypothetical protein [Spirulina sp. 06S082]|uniref:hypothetical protein n=1 Tax=Spirulina sp. 06S082 TaxID=3110248 RepID=UPI002B203E51|nr:hypothetical protein [Spirulina sp. 06S082]MEA5471204.1 hypothetical protein [Spirulina sp. 06S082]
MQTISKEFVMHDPDKLSMSEKLSIDSYQYGISESFLTVHETEISLNFENLKKITSLKPIICKVEACPDHQKSKTTDRVEVKMIFDEIGKTPTKVEILRFTTKFD